MKNDEPTFYKIEDYLSGKLSPEAARDFEQEIAADSELAETVELHRLEREGLDYMMELKLRAEMESWKTNPPTSEPSPAAGKSRRWPYLGLMLVLLLAALFFWQPWSEEEITPAAAPPSSAPVPQQEPIADNTPVATPEKALPPAPTPLQKSYGPLAKSSYRLPDNLRSRVRDAGNSTSPTPLSEAEADFSKNPPDYAGAIVSLKKISQKDQPQAYETAREMLAHAYFNTGRYAQAAELFEQMTRQNLSAGALDQAEWYWLLSMLPDYERKQQLINKLLDKMTNPEAYHDYATQAVELKEKLK
jgi:tetratricopeptide (TPR) repeat protein